MIRARIASPRPAGAASVGPADVEADLGLAEKLGQRRDDQRAGDRAGEAAHAADHQHRHDQEGEVEVEGLDPHRAEEMGEQHAGDAGQEGGDARRRSSRWRTMWTPEAAAAASSSREARSSSAERVSW